MDNAATDFISRHLSDEQMTEIAAEEWRRMCRDYFTRNHATAIGNITYPMVRELVSEVLGGDADQVIRDKALEVINGLSSYTVFHEPNVYDTKPSPAWALLMKAVEDNREVVEERVRHHLHNLSKNDALEIIKSAKLTIQTGAS